MGIETKRLLLRKPMLADFDEYWLMKNNKAATQYTGGITPYGYEERLALYQKEWVDANQTTELSIVLKSTGEYLGYCGFVDENELLYGIKRSAWGDGYGYEAAAAMLSYGFTVLHLPCIVATVHPKRQGCRAFRDSPALNPLIAPSQTRPNHPARPPGSPPAYYTPASPPTGPLPLKA